MQQTRHPFCSPCAICGTKLLLRRSRSSSNFRLFHGSVSGNKSTSNPLSIKCQWSQRVFFNFNSYVFRSRLTNITSKTNTTKIWASLNLVLANILNWAFRDYFSWRKFLCSGLDIAPFVIPSITTSTWRNPHTADFK